jgi:hypothetical protein
LINEYKPFGLKEDEIRKTDKYLEIFDYFKKKMYSSFQKINSSSRVALRLPEQRYDLEE